MASLGQMLMQGPNSGSYTPETLTRRRQMAEALMKGGSGIQDIRHPLQGLAQMLQTGVGAYHARQAEEQEATAREEANARIAQLLQGGMDAPMGDLLGAAGDPWASDANQQLAMMLLGEQIKKQNTPEPGPDWQTLESGGDTFRWNAADPNSRPELFFDGPDAAADTTRPMTAEEKAAYGLAPDAAAQIDASGKVTAIGGGQTINVGGNNDIGTIPQGMMITRDEAGKVTGMVPIPGGPAEREALAAEAQENARADIAETTGNIVTQDIDRALNLIDTPNLLPTTGFGANWFNTVGGTAGNDLRNLLNTVKANTAFDALQQMRAASPTGGALGAVTAPELTLLEAAKGAVEQSQSPQQLKDNLIRLQNIYLDIVHGPGQGPERKVPSFEQEGSPSAPETPQPGAVMDGYRFKGGDPADPNSWEKV